MDRFPSTPHLPFSPEVASDDIKMEAAVASAFIGQPVIITEKLDGGNCCLFRGKVYARTHKHEASHASFGPIKSLSIEVLEEMNNKQRNSSRHTSCSVSSCDVL